MNSSHGWTDEEVTVKIEVDSDNSEDEVRNLVKFQLHKKK
jgi:hypothetical protein